VCVGGCEGGVGMWVKVSAGVCFSVCVYVCVCVYLSTAVKWLTAESV